MENLIIFGIYSVLLVIVMLVAEFAYKVFKLNTEWTRKIAHVSSGIIALTYPIYIDSHWIVFALTLSFTIILYGSKKMGLFKSIFAVGRESNGTLYFVWSTWLLFLLSRLSGDINFFYLGFSSVVFADPAAALIGKTFPLKKYTIFGNTKSFGGSISFFIISFVLTFYFTNSIFTLINNSDLGFIKLFTLMTSFNNVIIFSIAHALILTVTEAISTKGLDNITIPIVSILFVLLSSIIL